MKVQDTKIKEMDRRNESYVHAAKAKLASLGKEIEKLKAEPSQEPAARASDWEVTVQDLRQRLSNLGEQVEDLRRGGEQQWSELQTKVETGLWDMRAVLQRVVDRSQPLVAFDDDDGRTRYFLQKAEHGRWGLQRQGAQSAVKYFDNKAEALHFSRRYVRQNSPSELIVRRLDGTFEAVHNYR